MARPPDIDDRIRAAAEAVRTADALLVGAGAGMGVDSGLPDFRGPEGFWKAYPAFRGRQFAEMSNPEWFRRDPAVAWGFFGHRLNLYTRTEPHPGFALLKTWMESRPAGGFVFTSNVDGQFQKAGFPEDRVLECHGSIRFLQCVRLCREDVWPADGVRVEVDEAAVRAVGDLPHCPNCGGLARPNILMFGDWEWIGRRTDAQRRRYREWLAGVRGLRVAGVELGAGLAIPTVRDECGSRADVLVRINPREPDTPPGGIALPLGALDALRAIAERLG